MEFEFPPVEFGPFGLEEDFSRSGMDVEGFVDEDPVDVILQGVSLGNVFDVSPAFAWAFDILLAPEAEDVIPIGIASEPVDSAAEEFLAGLPCFQTVSPSRSSVTSQVGRGDNFAPVTGSIPSTTRMFRRPLQ